MEAGTAARRGGGTGTRARGGRSRGGTVQVDAAALERLLAALVSMRDGNLRRRLTVSGDGVMAEISAVFNEVADRQMHVTGELSRVRRVVGREGKLSERLEAGAGEGAWAAAIEAANALVDDLARPVSEVGRVLSAVAEGDLDQRMDLRSEGADGTVRPLRGEFLKVARTANNLVDQLSVFASEVTRVAVEVGTDGKLGGQAQVRGVSGSWKDLTDSVNTMANRLTAQVRDIALVTTAVANGDLSQKVRVSARGEIAQLADTINQMTKTLRTFADEVTRVSGEVGAEGLLGGQAQVPGAAGTWKDLTDSVNTVFRNITTQVRDIAQVTTAVANGDLSQKVTVDVAGEMLEL
ncbi:HAMP domain-containing protein, partial [Streptomyces sp. NPDC058700]|uniref:HAMP domain-containing protein n=1 Tax=Streptomyces sp. NPDC058700 TaxID=3346607 RepID=UPI0036509194